MKDDKSPYGVYDMAGNVSEWTDTVIPSSQDATQKVAVIRGANFQTRSDEHAKLTYRVTQYAQDYRDFWLGFRCVSDTPPPAK